MFSGFSYAGKMSLIQAIPGAFTVPTHARKPTPAYGPYWKSVPEAVCSFTGPGVDTNCRVSIPVYVKTCLNRLRVTTAIHVAG
jgi:hypothetical protein